MSHLRIVARDGHAADEEPPFVMPEEEWPRVFAIAAEIERRFGSQETWPEPLLGINDTEACRDLGTADLISQFEALYVRKECLTDAQREMLVACWEELQRRYPRAIVRNAKRTQR